MTFPLSIEDEESWFNNMQQTPIEEHPLVIDVLKGDIGLRLATVVFIRSIGVIGQQKSVLYWGKGLLE
jgi:hypothetical protein